MSVMRIPCYGLLSSSCSASKGIDFGFDAAFIRLTHTCAETIWFNTMSSAATTEHCPLSSGASIDIANIGRTPVFSYTGTSCNKMISLFAFGL